MKTSKLITSTRFFGTLFFCAIFTSITVAQTTTEPAILERTAKALKIADQENYCHGCERMCFAISTTND